ncbi:hypothetical protein [Pseudomonas putida]|uniref:hypothetical protein n=1 Tax=Pseudomonas putida TaxID=303 RepID=UPI0005799B19|nr:hypothetical protein [Pseudomonas putida]
MKGKFEKFSISYDAESEDLSKHKINAKDLGKAIAAVSDLLDEATLIYTKGGADIELMVTAPAKKGSVIVDFLVHATSPGALEVLKYLGFASATSAVTVPTIFQVVEKLKNRKITSVVIESGKQKATVKTEDGDIQCDPKLAEMISNKKIRDALHRIVQVPLHDKPKAKFKVLDKDHSIIATVDERKIDDYAPLPKGALEEVAVENEHLSISFAQVNFDSSKGWKIVLPNGEEKSATMKDETFLRKVKANQQGFKKGDSYEAKIRITTTSRPTRSTILYEVVEVTRHWVKKEDRLI